jgi:2-polyprenyl-3-methyl-5-hydroxy-6-metoxy-1,4-benzoquinol methylase
VTAPSATCPICRQSHTEPWAVAYDVEYRTSEDGFQYWRCLPCGVLFLDPPPITKLAEIYPSNYYAYSGGKQSLVHRVKDRLDASLFRRLLRQLPGRTLRVLDIGGGDGWLLGIIRSLDGRVTLTQVVDIDPGAEERARLEGHEYFCGRAEDFQTDVRFDLILMLNIIEHVADPAAVLSRARELLAPTGLILLKTPNANSLDARLFRNRNWGGYHCPRHWVIFEGETLTRVASEAHLDVRRLTYTQGAPFWTVSTMAWLAKHELISIAGDRPMVRHPLFPILSAAFGALDLTRSSIGAKTSQMFVELIPSSSSESDRQNHSRRFGVGQRRMAETP